MYIMSKQNPGFDQADKGMEAIADEFKALGQTKYPQHKVTHPIFV